MQKSTSIRKPISLAVLFLLSAAALAAGTISINANSAPYNSNQAITSVNYTSIDEVVTGGMTAATGMYRTIHGIDSAPVNTTVNVTWTDGSKSTGKVISTTASVGVVPTGNPTPPPSGGSGDPGDGSGSSGGGSTTGPGGCTGTGCPGKGVVTVGPIDKVT